VIAESSRSRKRDGLFFDFVPDGLLGREDPARRRAPTVPWFK